MSRWGKSGMQKFALPLDAFVKEKENTNRPIAARSAGTVGKWGITSFTSIRGSNYGFSSFSPKQDSSNPSISPQSTYGQHTPSTQPSTAANDFPKPKKFFKSRNVAPVDFLTTVTQQKQTMGINDHHNPSSPITLPTTVVVNSLAPITKVSLKINKKQKIDDTTKKLKTDKTKSKKKSSKTNHHKDELKVRKAEEQPTRVLPRARKAVNYIEENSRSPSPSAYYDASSVELPTLEIVEPVSSLKIPSISKKSPEQLPSCQQLEQAKSNLQLPPPLQLPAVTPTLVQPILAEGETIINSTFKHLTTEGGKDPKENISTQSTNHPPIVLRISKGTSRLVSTDSEDINTSPYVSPKAIITSTSTGGALSSTAELLAVLTDDSPPLLQLNTSVITKVPDEHPLLPIIETSALSSQPNKILETPNAPEPSAPVVTEIRPEGIKIKIKKLAKAFVASSNDNELESKAERKPISVPLPISVKKHIQLPIRKSSRRKPLIVKPTATTKQITKVTRTTTTTTVTITAKEKMASPQPGSENYDLYRTLTASPTEEKDFDSQSSLMGSVSSNFATDVPEDSRVIHSRGSSDVTSDHEDTSQDSSLVAPPSEMDLQLAAMMECDPSESAVIALSLPPPLPIIISQPKIDTVLKMKSISKETMTTSSTTATETVKLNSITINKMSVVDSPKEEPVSEGRVTRNKNGITNKKINLTAETERPQLVVTRSYGRKRKTVDKPSSNNNNNNKQTASHLCDVDNIINVQKNTENDATLLPMPSDDNVNSTLLLPLSRPIDDNFEKEEPEYKFNKKIRKIDHKLEHTENRLEQIPDLSCENLNNNSEMLSTDEKQPSVKLVISKKKGSIFKSRAIDAETEGNNKKPKRHVYKHKWVDNSKEKVSPSDSPEKLNVSKQYYSEFEDGEPSNGGAGGCSGSSSGGIGGLGTVRVVRQRTGNDDDNDGEEEEQITSVKCNTKVKKFYTVVRNVKKAHQIQEIGEFQEMDDDIEYILDALQPHNKMSTRCLSAIQLASKCMTPAFRMHVRAHGTITKFFKSLIDAARDQSLGLCTATVMFVLNQDNLNMDLDRDSLELMLNLLESDVSHKNALDDCGLTRDQLQRNKLKVKELCSEIKNQGKAVHLNLDNITVGTLAMETLLSLTSKRAGEWFKEELRKLGGLEHIIKTICECCRQISDYVVDWTDLLLEKLRKIERCLRVLENVSQENEENQTYILSYENGHAVDTLLKFYKLCDSEITLYPTVDGTPKENPGVVLREALVPTIKVLINLTHSFNTTAFGSGILGEKPMVFNTSLHLLLEAHNYVPESCIFDISILVLLLLINLTMYTLPNRTIVMNASAPSDFGNKFIKVSAVKALIEYFYKCEELAKAVERNTDDILNNPEKLDGKKSQEEVDETVTKLLQKAGHHMEHTMLASYVCLLIGHLIMDNNLHQQRIRSHLKGGQFTEMVQILEKYYNFMNLTASSASATVEHIKQTKTIIEYLRNSDLHSNGSTNSSKSNSNNKTDCTI